MQHLRSPSEICPSCSPARASFSSQKTIGDLTINQGIGYASTSTERSQSSNSV